jgi:hypothetical protein
MARRGTSPDGSKQERRKANRFLVSVPVEVSWRGSDNKAVKEQAAARQVNSNGGFLEMATYPEFGSRITLTNFLSAETAEARVLGTPHSREGVSHGIVIELIVPSETFWGVNLQVKKTSIELQKLEQSLRSEGIDLRLLNEFRDAVDYVRTVALVVQQSRDRQLNGLDDKEIGSLLAVERIRRTTNHCLEVITDLDAGGITSETKGVEELYLSLEQACDRLKHLLKGRELDRRLTARK